jgi:hypothetical protein
MVNELEMTSCNPFAMALSALPAEGSGASPGKAEPASFRQYG